MDNTKMIQNLDETINRLSVQISILKYQMDIAQHLMSEAVQSYLVLKQSLIEEPVQSSGSVEE